MEKNQVIDRYCLNIDLCYQGMSYKNLCSMIDFWKVLLWEKYQIRPGSCVSIVVSLTDAYYLSSVLACLELGASLVITDKPVNKNYSGVRQRVFGDLDLALFDDINWNDQEVVDCNRLYFKNLASLSEFDSYQIQDHSLWNDVSKKTFATPTSVALLTTTSGTTGVPKVIKRDHAWILDSSKRSIKIFDLKKTQSVLHTRQLSHGAVLDLFLLPTLMAVDHHYVFNDHNNTSELVDFIVKHEINKFVIFTQHEKHFKTFPVLSHTLDIISLITPKKEWVSLVQSKNINSLVSSFGSSESGNAVFLSIIDQNTDPNTFEPNNYRQLLDDHYKVSLGSDTVSITVKKFNHTAVLDDKFELINDNYYLIGRSNRFRIHDIFITQDQVNNIVKKHLSVEFEAVIDQPDQQIYLAVYQPVNTSILNAINQDLNDYLHKNIKIDCIRLVDFATFNPGFKVSRDLMINYFRSLNH